MSDTPYKQGELEKLEATIAKGGAAISQPVLWKGGLGEILGVVRQLQHRCGFPERSYQVKFNADVNVLRLSDYHTRMACQPGEYFWLVGQNIRGGDMTQYERERALVEGEERVDVA